METPTKKMSKTTIWIIVALIVLIAIVVLYFTVIRKKSDPAKRIEKTREELIDEAMPEAIAIINAMNRPDAEKTAIKSKLTQAKLDILVQWNTPGLLKNLDSKSGIADNLWTKAQYIYSVGKR